jgi:hypothetical protein
MNPKCWSCETENPEYDDNDCCLACDAPREIANEVFNEQVITKPENVIVVL